MRDPDVVPGQHLLAHGLVAGNQQGLRRGAGIGVPLRLQHAGYQVLQTRVSVERLGRVEDQVRPHLVQAADQVLQVVAHPDQGDLVTPLAQGVRDLVLHLGFIVVPGGHFLGHLPLMLGMVPPGVGGVENDGDSHGGKLDRQGSCMGVGSGISPLVRWAQGLHFPASFTPLVTSGIRSKAHRRSDGVHSPGSQAEA
jgi:hypothetical protein